MKFNNLLIVVFSTFYATSLVAQDASDLYLFQLETSADHSYRVFQPKLLSAFNAGGYTNQPWFVSNDELLVSVRKMGEKQNDIYLLSLKADSIRQLTHTAENEYSPRLHPNGKILTMLRQVVGDSINQQVFIRDMQGMEYVCLTPQFRNIGYYAWLDNVQLVLFRIEGEANHLELLNLTDNRKRRITSSVGRTLLTDSDGSIIYLDKSMSTNWVITKYFPETDVFHPVVNTPGASVDFTFLPDGTYFMGVGSKLYCFNPLHDNAWQEVADLSVQGIDVITRLSVSPDGKQLALVATKIK